MEWGCCSPTISIRDHQKFFPGRCYRTIEVIFSSALFISGVILVVMGFHLSITAIPLTFVPFFQSFSNIIDAGIVAGFAMAATAVMGYMSETAAGLRMYCLISGILFCLETGVGVALVVFQCEFPSYVQDLTSCLKCYARLTTMDTTIPAMSGILLGLAACHLMMLYIMVHHISYLKLYKDISDQDFSWISSQGSDKDTKTQSLFLPSMNYTDTSPNFKCNNELHGAHELLSFTRDSLVRYLPVASTPIQTDCPLRLPCTARCCNLSSDKRTKTSYRDATGDASYITAYENCQDNDTLENRNIQSFLNASIMENSQSQDTSSVANDVCSRDETIIFRDNVQALLPVLLKDNLGLPSCLKDPFETQCSPPPPPPPTPATPSDVLSNKELNIFVETKID